MTGPTFSTLAIPLPAVSASAATMHINHCTGPRSRRVERRRGDVERVVIGLTDLCQRVR